MSAFSPSPQFTKRWLSTPVAVKQAFHQELEDIIAMLKSDEPAQMFAFTHDDFNVAIKEKLHTYDRKKPPTDTPPAPPKLMDTGSDELTELEERIYKKLSARLEDLISEQMLQVSDDLKAWLMLAIKEELTAQPKNKELL